MAFKILGISASLRNARRGLGKVSLLDEINSITTEEGLRGFIKQEAETHLQNFIEAGRKDKLPFDEMYRELKKLKGNKGLSNSEIALTVGLWSAKELGAELDYVSLSEHFNEKNEVLGIESFRKQIMEADAFLFSTPVYFGDRSSLGQTFIEFIRQDPELLENVKGKVYAGISVGAKRNGGQETTLIYQLLDMINCGMLGVGNDSETTSQYGGTGLAGDIGTMQKDDYGLSTAMGTGRRLARVTNMLSMAKKHKLKGKPKVMFWIMQDKNDVAFNKVQEVIKKNENNIEAYIADVTKEHIMRCIACDICPVSVDIDETYRCIIKSKKDDLMKMHTDLLDYDAIIPVVYSPKDRAGLKSNYQQFLERTRYFRRGDYVFSDALTAPFVIEDIGVNENMSIRSITSMIRHHTIVSKPMILFLNNGEEINSASIDTMFEDCFNHVNETTKGRLLSYSSKVNHLKYKPVGYVLSSNKDAEDEKLSKRSLMIESRVKKFSEQAKEKIEKSDD